MNLIKARKDIDKIDDKIIKLLAKRLSLVKKIGIYKLRNNIKIYQPIRELEIFNEKGKVAEKYNLRKKYIKDLFKRIIKESHYIQK